MAPKDDFYILQQVERHPNWSVDFETVRAKCWTQPIETIHIADDYRQYLDSCCDDLRR